jgi:S1-C subfamily serine protease
MFIMLNIAIGVFVVLKIGWRQVVAVPTFLYNSLIKPTSDVNGSNTSQLNQANLVSGIINDSNIKLIHSEESFADAVAKVRAAVVNISSSSIEPSPPSGAIRFDDPYQDLNTLGGIGSGIIVDPSGYILTCLHVVSNASNVFVTPFASKANRYHASIVDKDDSLNLAMLKVNLPGPFPSANIGDSNQMEVADWVLAIGSPFGLEQSVTHGIISDNDRDLLIDHRLFSGMVQTDVPINRGSSGGPLINIKGEVIGINMAIYSTSQVYNGVSFAMPIDKVKPFLSRNIR